MPILTNDYNPRIVRNLVRTADILRKEDEFLDEIASVFFSRSCLHKSDESIALDISRLMEFQEPLQMRVLRKAIESQCGDLKRIGFKHIESLMDLLSHDGPNRSILLPGGIVAERRYNELIIQKKAEEKLFHYSFYEIPQQVILEEIDKKVQFQTVQRDENFRMDLDPNSAFMDFSEIRFPIIIRSFQEGDRFQPMGMEGTKKLKNFFVDNKIPRSIRRQIPLLTFGDLMAWVMGYRIDHRVRVKESTRKIPVVQH